MNISTLFDLLNEDLQREFAHWHFYQNAATSIRGLHRQEISEFLLEQAAGEQKHVEAFQRLLHGIRTRRGLGDKKIAATAIPYEYTSGQSKPEDILKYALEMEDKVVRYYVKRIQDCEKLQESRNLDDMVDGKYIELFLEDQILDSRGDADHIREMLEDLTGSGN